MDGFNTIFCRAMRKAVEDTENEFTWHFQLRDLRAKSALDDTREAVLLEAPHFGARKTHVDFQFMISSSVVM